MRGQAAADDILGLDIGASHIKFALVRKPETEDDDYTMLSYGSHPVPRGAIIDGQVANSELLIGALKEMVAEHNLQGMKTSFAVANESASLSLLIQPVIEGETEVEKQLHIANAAVSEFADMRRRGNVVFDYAELQTTARRRHLQLAAVSGSMVSSFVQAVKKAGLAPVACELAPVAEARALTLRRDPRGENVQLIVNIGADKTLFTVRSGPEVLFYRTVPIGGNDVTEEIASKLGTSFEEAEQVKQIIGLIPQDHQDPAVAAQIGACQDAMLEVVDRLVAALHDMRTFYETDGQPINALALVGGGTRLQGLQEKISLYINIPMVEVRAREGFEEIPEFDLYGTAAGLSAQTTMSLLPANAARTRGAIASKINLKKAEGQAKKLAKRSPATNPLLIGLAIGFLALIGCYWYAGKINTQNAVIPPPVTTPVVTTPQPQQAPTLGGPNATPLVVQVSQLLQHQAGYVFLTHLDALVRADQVQQPQVVVSENQVSFSGTVADMAAYDTLHSAVSQLPDVNLAQATPQQVNGAVNFTFSITPKATG